MRALVKSRNEEGLWMEEVEKPSPGPGEVLIKVKKTAICGTDVHIYKWNDWARRTIPVPMTVGHEFVGTVEETGGYVEGIFPGELVSAEGHIVCGVCRNCLAGRRHLCKDTVGIGVNRTGAFAEYISVPAKNVWHCDPSLPLDVLACLDPLGNAVHTALQYDLNGEDVLITGAGPIGSMAAAITRHCGAKNVVITDVNDFRLSLAKEVGATRTVNILKENLEDVMKEIHMKEGFDVGLEMSGNSGAFSEMVNRMIHGGKIAVLGLISRDTLINWDTVIFNMLSIKGIYGREMFDTWYKMTSLLKSGLDISPLITHRFKVEDFQKGFDAMLAGQAGKVVLDWES